MKIDELLCDKSLKPKAKTETLSQWLLDCTISPHELIAFAQSGKDSAKATCIEALEFATKQNPSIANEACLEFVTRTLTEKAPRVKWESAKVIGNIAHLYPAKLTNAVSHLLANAGHEGTVVRWSAAFALGEILKLKTRRNKQLIRAIETVCRRERKSSIKKIYLDAMEK